METEEGKSLIKKEKKPNKETILLISMVIIIILIDQGLKIWIQNVKEINLIPGILNLKSPDISVNLERTIPFLDIVTDMIILGVCFKFIMTQNNFLDKKMKIFISFILAGGISNIIDKIIKGYVIEFIDFRQVVNVPLFNLADIVGIVGWIVIAIIVISFAVKECKNKEEKRDLKDDDNI